MKFFIRLGIAALLTTVAWASDLTITMSGTGKYNEGPQTQYWSAKFMKIANPGSQMDTLIDYEKGINYSINHKKKTVEMIAWDDLEAAVEGMAQQFKNMPPAVLKMMGGGDDVEVSVQDEGKEQIVGRTCRKWKITMGKMVIETSNDPSLKPPVMVNAYQRYLRMKHLAGAMGPMAMQMKKLGEEFSKIQGMALRNRTVMPIVGEITSVATEVKEGPIPAATFALPADYKLIDRGKEMAKSFRK